MSALNLEGEIHVSCTIPTVTIIIVNELLLIVMDQGEIGDSMYIIYTGECGVYIFKSEHDGLSGSHKAVAILGANTAVGETAVVDKFDDGLRTATVVAHTDVVAVRLTKTDYQRILY